jgi:hypothetical protein
VALLRLPGPIDAKALELAGLDAVDEPMPHKSSAFAQ